MDKSYKNRTPEDILAHYGEEPSEYHGAISVPIFQTSLFSRKGGEGEYRYTRVSNPTVEVPEKKIAMLEGADKALLFSSGMAALTAGAMHLLKPGARIACVKNAYYPMSLFFSEYLRKKMGVVTAFFDADDDDSFLAAVRENTDLVYLETCVSNVFLIPDIPRICTYTRERGIQVMVDNSYATPVFCNPLSLGANLVAHSCSKYIGGHSDLIGGALAGNADTMNLIQNCERSVFGGVMDPHQAWLILRSLRTLSLRMERHMENGLALARYLEGHEKIHRVIHPGLESHPQHGLAKEILRGYSGVFAFVPEGGKKAGERLMKLLEVPEHGPSWGGHETLLNCPGFGNEAAVLEQGMLPGQIRISVGLENSETLIMDFERALKEI